MQRSIKVIITDLDGVIRHFPTDRDRQIETKFRLPKKTFANAAFEPTLLENVITGKMTDEAWRSAILSKLVSNFPDADCDQAFQVWSQFPGEVDHGVIAYFESIKLEMGIALLTNATSRLHQDLSALGIAGKFRRIFNSSEIGLTKPSLELFRLVCREIGIQPNEALFIDDSERNVAAASEIGLIAVHFRSFDSLQRELPSYINF